MSNNNITSRAVLTEAALQSVEPTSAVRKEEQAETEILNNLPDPQVKLLKNHKLRRSFSQSYKKRILAAYDACSDATQRGKLLRREGLYHSRISAWKKQQASGSFDVGKAQSCKNSNLRSDRLIRENMQLKKKLAQAEAIIALQKKVSELLGEHILPQEMNGRSS